MLDLGLGALAHANRHAAYAAVENASWPDLAVLQAAHAAELLIKARIAQEHPLLIFDHLPHSSQAAREHLDIEDLFKQGRTVQWSDLPERLWAATGTSIPNRGTFDSFGRLRNGIQHFGPPPGRNASDETLRFVFDVIDPFINQCWGLFAIDYDEDDSPCISFLHSCTVRLDFWCRLKLRQHLRGGKWTGRRPPTNIERKCWSASRELYLNLWKALNKWRK
jgi:hypothetical protein